MYETKAKQNLYETRMWQEVIGKSKSDVSFRSYLVGNEIMLNHQVDKHSLAGRDRCMDEHKGIN